MDVKNKDHIFISIFLIILVFAWTFSCLSGCSGKNQEEEVEAVARVNGEMILKEELDHEMLRIDKNFSVKASHNANQRFIDEVLRHMIQRRLLLQEAHNHHIALTPEQIQRAVSEQKGGILRKDLEKLLEKEGITYTEWKQRITEDRIIETLIHKLVDPKINISEDELTAYYQYHPEEFQVPERVSVRQIVLANRKDAKKVRERLTDGKEDFGQLAQEISLSPDAVKGGDIGVFTQGEMPPEFEVCFSLQIGELSSVVKSPYGYHIFRVEDRLPAGQLSFKEERKNIYNKLFSEKREEAFTRYQEDLWNGAEISLLHKQR